MRFLLLTFFEVLPVADKWTFWLIILCVVPIAALIITALILAIRNASKNKDKGNEEIDYEQRPFLLDAYGGEDNFVSAKLDERRITVKVKNVELVDPEKLKNIGAKNALFVNDEVKASFGDLAANIYKILEK